MTGVLSSIIQLTGYLSPKGKLSGRLSEKGRLTGYLTIPETVCADDYEGAYTVTPRFYEQTLETQGKYMHGDVTVLEIPYFETSNLSGGTTVYIATEDI